MNEGDGREPDRPQRPARYPGDDTSLTTQKEINGFYAYTLAAEVFAVCGVGAFVPVTLEQLARERGVFWSDKTTPCVPNALSDNASSSAARLLTRAVAKEDNGQCVIRLFGMELTSASFSLYTFSIAVLVQALTLVSFSSFADHGHYRKRLLLIFAFTGATSSMLFLLVVPEIFVLGSLLTIIGVTCLGSSFVVLNSFLPLLVMNHPSVAHLEGNQELRTSKSSKLDSAELQLSSKISSKAVGIGYAASLFVQVLSILLLFIMSKISTSSTLNLRLVLFLVGVWWFLFTIPPMLWIRSRPGPPLSTITSHRGTMRICLAYIAFAWKALWRTIMVAGKLRQVWIFLIAWFLLSDAVATVSGTAILFARTELHMGTVPIALLSITAMTSGIVGAVCWPMISRRYGLQTNKTIVSCVLLMEIVPLYGLLGYLPFVQAWGFGGLQQAWEIYPLAFVHGFVMGGLSSYCRSFFGTMIPPGHEAAFYALFAITDKGSSSIGPAIVGAIVDATGSIRPAFIFLAILIALPAPLIWIVDAEKGKADAARMDALMKKSADSDVELNDHTENGFAEAEGLMRDHD